MARAGRFEVCASPERLADLRPSWDQFDTFLHAPTSRMTWVLACAESLADGDDLFVPVVLEDGVPVAAAALERGSGLLRPARQLGAGLHGEFGDFSYRDKASLGLLAETLARHHVALDLTRVPLDSPVPDALRLAYRRRGFVVVRPQPDCPYIEIDPQAADAASILPGRLRSDLRRARRKAEEFGALRVGVEAPKSESELLPIWSKCLDVEAAGWKGRSETALRADPRVGAFFRRYAVRACEQGILRILLLTLGGEPAAMMIAVETGDRFWILKIGFDERFAACSPGMLVMWEALDYAVGRRLLSYEFMGAAETWTQRWTKNGRATCGVYAYPLTLRGGLLFIGHAVGFLARRASRHGKG